MTSYEFYEFVERSHALALAPRSMFSRNHYLLYFDCALLTAEWGWQMARALCENLLRPEIGVGPKTVVVAPEDPGGAAALLAVKVAEILGHRLNCELPVVCLKREDIENWPSIDTANTARYGDQLKNRPVVVVDDGINRTQTTIKIHRCCRKLGAKKILASAAFLCRADFALASELIARTKTFWSYHFPSPPLEEAVLEEVKRFINE